MLRVIFVTASLAPGGAERHAVTLMNRLAERGHECHAVYLRNWLPSQIERVRLRDGGTVRCLDAARYLDARAVRDFAAHISRIGPTAVVAANPYALMYSRLALHRSGVRAPLVVTFHTTLLQSAKERLQMLCYRPLFWTADCLVFVCKAQRRRWLRRGVFSRSNEMIYNGVNTEEFCDRWNAGEERALRSALGFSDADYVIGITAYSGKGGGVGRRVPGSARILMYPTEDVAQVEAAINSVEATMFGAYTAIGDGIFVSILALIDQEVRVVMGDSSRITVKLSSGPKARRTAAARSRPCVLLLSATAALLFRFGW